MLLSVNQAAQRSGRDPETIRRWIRAGKLRAARDGNRHMIEEEELALATEEPRSVGVPKEWETLPSGRPQPDWVKILHRSRSSH